MNLEEVRANQGRTVTWHPTGGTPIPVVIQHILDWADPVRVWVRLVGFSSERDVDPEELETIDNKEGTTMTERSEPATEPSCAGALNLAGQHFSCDWPVDDTGTHDGWAHVNKDAQALWADSPDVIGSDEVWPDA
jgi:hypothetical protein